jgi:ATP/maltotriose-dependent transcriptional regulator MalT
VAIRRSDFGLGYAGTGETDAAEGASGFARERWLSVLDERREHPLIWVTAAPRSGKTTLNASCVDAQAPLRWYHVDAGDNDAGTFLTT